MADKMSAHSALVHVMVLTACADKELAEEEIRLMGEMIKTWPVFRSYDIDRLASDSENCLAYLEKEDGIDEMMEDIVSVLPARLGETAYALACDVAAADGDLTQTELEVLMIIRQSLGVSRLHAAAIEVGARARAMTI